MVAPCAMELGSKIYPADFVADAVLAIIPITLLRHVNKIATNQRKVLLVVFGAVFGASLLTTLASVVHTMYLLGPSGLLEGTTAQAEAAVSLLVANGGILITSVYRMLRRDDIEPKPFTYDYSIHSNQIIHPHRVASPTLSHHGRQESLVVFWRATMEVDSLSRANRVTI
ncbi:hypothetical protein C8R44DRAFT_947090 [Mycena epipterygia]|nr:hypothetical protein C8R44DRAFT_947090 [Mycena epipterygia]